MRYVAVRLWVLKLSQKALHKYQSIYHLVNKYLISLQGKNHKKGNCYKVNNNHCKEILHFPNDPKAVVWASQIVLISKEWSAEGEVLALISADYT